jgi:outer membrane receptor protein involved in Fe transport/opacity protein-like surface antigen
VALIRRDASIVEVRNDGNLGMSTRISRLLLLSSSALVSACLTGVALARDVRLAQTPPAPSTTPTPSATPETPPTTPTPTPATPEPAPQAPQTTPEATPPTPQATPSGPPALQVPAVTVTAPPAPPPAPRRATPQPQPQPATAAPTTPPTPQPTSVLAGQTATLNAARDNIYAPLGTAPSNMSKDAIAALPQGTNTPLNEVLLQLPGVTKDSAASGNFHVRNEHGNVQFRINGIMLPDNLSGFGQILDSGIIGNLALITGALPVQYGLRTAAVVDITTASGAFDNTGTFSVYGGSRETRRTSVEYGGRTGSTEYYFSGSYLQNILGIENPTPNLNAIHDFTQQARGFGYISTVIDPTTRLSLITGASVNKFQIPDNPGQVPSFTAFGRTNFDSAQLNENQIERNYFTVLALQKSVADVDLQLSYFTRYSSVHFTPDPIGDLMFNGAATDVFRGSTTNGIQADAAWRLNDAHTLRTGLYVSAEKSQVSTSYQLLPIDATTGAQILPDVPFGVVDSSSLLGWLSSVYVSDEWRITDKLTLNTGLRFDQMNQYVNANQLSPRVSVTYKPFEGTTFHAGYASNFTPPVQVIAAPTNTALISTCPPAIPNCTTVQAPTVPGPYGAVLPERSQVFDIGVVQDVFPGFVVGADAYYKYAKDLLDDGQFGAAYVLNGFNYDRGQNLGVELKANYTNGNFRAYANWAWARQKATNIVSNQYLFGPDEIAYIANHYVYTDHAQVWTGSAGMSYLWNGTRYSADLIYGSGLRSGDFNTDHVPAYAQVNMGVSHEFKIQDWKPVTARFDVVNVFDTVYVIRDGSGIGVFAPQYGPRRGFYFGLSQKFGPGADKPVETSNYYKAPTPKTPAADKTPLFFKAPVATAWTWAGYYLGANIGYGWGNSGTDALFSNDTGTNLFATSSSSGLSGVIGGAQTGYNWQIGNWLAGIEADLQLSGQAAKPPFVCPGTACNPFGPVVASFDQSLKMEWFATLRGRFGATVTRDTLLYVTGGVAVAGFLPAGTLSSFDATGAVAANEFDTLKNKVGWVVGAGAEAHVGGPWTAKVEYLHLDFGTVQQTAINDLSTPVVNVDFNYRITDNIVRLGLNYKFGSNGAITTKY